MNKILEHPYINMSAIARDLLPDSSDSNAALHQRIKRKKILMGDETDNLVLHELQVLHARISSLIEQEVKRLEERKEVLGISE